MAGKKSSTVNSKAVPLDLKHYIIIVRGQRVIIDNLYGIKTKRLNEQVKRNKERFPVDFMLQLKEAEKIEVVANCGHLINLKYSSNLPYAFTEHGTVMAVKKLYNPLRPSRPLCYI